MNPLKLVPVFKSLDGNNTLSEAIKSFSLTAKSYQIDFIKRKLGQIKPSNVTHTIIPVTIEEEEKLSSESSLTNKELISIIQTLIGSLNETNHPQSKGLASKRKDELLLILQEVRDIYNNSDINEIEEE